MSMCVRCLVSGRVQGVFYRAATQAEARRLGLTGWVSNRIDGRVEVVVCGPEEAVRELREWLWKGPELARVTEVRCEAIDPEPFANFRIR